MNELARVMCRLGGVHTVVLVVCRGGGGGGILPFTFASHHTFFLLFRYIFFIFLILSLGHITCALFKAR